MIDYKQGHTVHESVNWVVKADKRMADFMWPFLIFEDKHGTGHWVDYDLVESYRTLTDSAKGAKLNP